LGRRRGRRVEFDDIGVEQPCEEILIAGRWLGCVSDWSVNRHIGGDYFRRNQAGGDNNNREFR
jgi:hypothetical protein